jgi:molecular chaperone DnaK (HSP70)
MPLPHRVSANKVVIDYLHALFEHIPKVLKDQIGPALDSLTFQYVITVPAMWPEKAKAQTRTCAEKAGFGRAADIQIISEPEAAAVHVMTRGHPPALKVDDTIVICDAGGGTVDCITFTIIALQPVLRLRESAPGSGKLCGGVYLNSLFENFLSGRLAECEGWDDDTLEAAMHEFEMDVKRTFNGDVKQDFLIPVPGLADNVALDIHRGLFKVTGQELMELSLPVLRETLELVMYQIRLSKQRPNSVFLVGGFGQSPLLFQYLRRSVPSEISIIAPVNGWTAVARGACAKAVAEMSHPVPPIEVQSRVARKHYGIYVGVPFKEGHDLQKR